METVLRPGCALPARFGLGVGCRACVLSRCQASLALASDEAREGKKKEGKKEKSRCAGHCVSVKTQKETVSLSQGWLCPLGNVYVLRTFIFKTGKKKAGVTGISTSKWRKNGRI